MNNSETDTPSIQKCSAKSNIVFIKTHKTAGSTVQNIIFRYGLGRNLTFALPAGGHRFRWPRYFERSSVLQEQQNRSKTVYNILCHHTRFHYANMRDFMPEDSVYITVVRNPIAVFISAFEYFNVRNKYSISQSNAIEAFLERPSYFVGNYGKKPFFRNPIFFDLGYNSDQLVSERLIKRAIEYLDGIFSVVFVSDYFEESMVLLRHTLCCNINDVTYFNLNVRKTTSSHYLSNDVLKKIKEWNKADWMLFDHFNKSLWHKLSTLPFDWTKEANKLKEKNMRLQAECIKTQKRSSSIKNEMFKFFEPPGTSIFGIVLYEDKMKNKTCVNMAKAESPFTKELKKRYNTYLSES
ncbi:galactosylceramide sulfotransferase-like [Branchiostoma floridae x Branchiostoma belcheri]